MIRKLFFLLASIPTRYSGDPYLARARRDQKMAVSPGCESGLMDCLSQSCGCFEQVPSMSFIKSRAQGLRDRDFERLLSPGDRDLLISRTELKRRGKEILRFINSGLRAGATMNDRRARDRILALWPDSTRDEVEYIMEVTQGGDPDWDHSLGGPTDRTDTCSGRALLRSRGNEVAAMVKAKQEDGLCLNMRQARDWIKSTWPDLNDEEVSFVMDVGQGLDPTGS